MSTNSRRRPLDGLEDEIREHIERETAENIERGMTPEAARLAALRKFGNVARSMEETRAVWQWAWVEQLLQDARYSVRLMRRSPRFSAVVVLTLALGIGMNTAVFSVVNTVLLKPVDYPDAGRMVALGTYDASLQREFVYLPDFDAWRAQTHSYTRMAAYGYHQAALAAPGGTSQVTGVYVAGDFWSLTGARAAAGRLFDPAGGACLVLAWDSFEQFFGGDLNRIGKPVVLNGSTLLLTGVLPRGFTFQLPMWWTSIHPEAPQVYLTVPPRGQKMAGSAQAVAVLAPGAGIGRARAELEALEKRLMEADGRVWDPRNLRVDPLADKMTGGARRGLLVLQAAGLCILLIAILNVANLLLARGTLRAREVAVRAAVGAGRGRVIRQLLAESVLMAVAGGAAGLLLACLGIGLLKAISPFAVPRLAQTTLDARVLGVTLALAALTGVLSGAGPARAVWRANLHGVLKEGARNSPGPASRRTRQWLAAAELALAIVLLTGAGLLWKSFEQMNRHAPGFVPERVAVMSVRFSGKRYVELAGLEAERQYVSEVLRQIERVPGVEAAGVSSWIFHGRAGAFPVDSDPGTTHMVRVNAISPGYPRALGMTLKKGRWLTDTDSSGVLVNESMARVAFGAADPIGRELRLPRRVVVVGVAADLKYSKLDAPPLPEVLVPYQRSVDLPTLNIAARIAGSVPLAMGALRKNVAAIDPGLAVYDVKTLEQALQEGISPRRFNLLLLGAFALCALVLAIIGVYGVMAYSVAERTREFGVRMALGARRGQVASMVVREAVPAAMVGIGAGLTAAWGLTRLMTSLLYEVEAGDSRVFTTAAIALALTAMAATVIPALRAASIDPAVSLRYE